VGANNHGKMSHWDGEQLVIELADYLFLKKYGNVSVWKIIDD